MGSPFHGEAAMSPSARLCQRAPRAQGANGTARSAKVQTRKHGGNVLPPDVLASISGYYRRVTTEAYPMNRLVAVVMLLTLAAICAEIWQGENAWWIGWVSLLLAGSGFVPTMMRTVPNARRLGSAQDSAEEQSRLARAVCRDHMFSFARMSCVLILQLIAR